MNRLTIILIFSLATIHSISAQSVGMGTTSPDSSAILDLASVNQGLLVPRMTDTQRNAITNPADGLLVYVTSDSTFYCFDGIAWVTLNTRTRELIDADQDTKIMVEVTPDEDVIHYEMAGVEYFRMVSGRLEVMNTGQSVFIGDGAGANDDFSNNFNAGVGDSSLAYNTTGNLNVAVGHSALKQNTSGKWNVATGMSALISNTTGNYNTASGTAASRENTTGSYNASLGTYALRNSTTASYNTALGSLSLENNTTAVYNTAVGYTALRSNTTGLYNTSLGASALLSNTTGSFNTATGFRAMENNTTGGGNTTSGHGSLFLNTTGIENVAIGNRAIRNGTISSQNVAIGSHAMLTNTKGSFNTVVGYMADVGSDSLVNSTAIGANAKVGQSNSMVLGDSVNVGIGTSTPQSSLHIVNNANSPNEALEVEGISRFTADDGIYLMYAESPSTVGSWLTLNNTSPGGKNFNFVSTGSANGEGAGKLLIRSNEAWNNGLGIPLTIDNLANVGVGTVNPQDKLHILGNARIDGGRIEFFNTGQSVFIGAGAGANDDFSNNQTVAVGYQALFGNVGGSFNTGIGHQALRQNSTGNFNTAVGYYAQFYNTTGKYNTAFGSWSLLNHTTGEFNTAIGYSNQAVNKVGTYITTLGAYADVSVDSLTYATAIGANAIVSQSNSIVLGRVTDKVGIGTSAPGTILANSKLDVIGGHILVSNNFGVLSANSSGNAIGAGFDTGTGDELFLFAGGTNKLTIAPVTGDLTLHNGTAYKTGGGSWIATSDRRLKSNIKPFDIGLADVVQINPVKFNYNELSGYDTDKQFIGVIAQELNEVAPYMVGTFKKDGVEYYNVDNSAMTFMLINAVKELSKLNEQTQTQLSRTEKEYLQLKKYVLHNEAQAQISSLESVNSELAAQNEQHLATLNQVQDLLLESLMQLTDVKSRLSALESPNGN
jgi:trimeric autotransporter adhesin